MREWRTPRRAVSAMFIFNGALMGMWAARIPAYVERFSLAPQQLGVLLLCIAGGAILAFPLAGRASDRIGAATLTRGLVFLYAFGLIAVSLAPSVWALGVALALLGAGYGGMDVTMNAWAAEVERSLGRPVMASFHAMYSLGSGLGAMLVFAAVSVELGVALQFRASALVLGALALWIAAVPWTSTRSTRAAPMFARPTRALTLVGLVAVCTSVGEGAMKDWSAVFLTTVVNADAATAALGYAVFSAVMVVSRLSGDAAVRRLGPVTAARGSGAFAASGVALAMFGGSTGTVLCGFALMGVGYAVIVPLAFSRAAADPDLSPGRAIAAVATFGYGGALIGPPLIGALAGVLSLRLSFGLLCVLALAIIVLAPALRVPPRDRGPSRPRPSNLDPGGALR